MPIMHIHIARGSQNRKLTGLPLTEGGKARKDARIWVVNPVGFGPDASTPRKGRTYELCPLDCVHLPTRFGGTADADCYADGPTLWTADRIPGIPTYEGFRILVEAMADGSCEAIRWAVVGDMGRTKSERTKSKMFLATLRHVASTFGVPVIEYTHAWKGEQAHSEASNASCDTLDEVQTARDLGWQPVYVAPDEATAREVARSHGGFVCPEMVDRADGCFAGRTTRSEGRRTCGGKAPLCSVDRRQSLMVLINH